MKKDITTAPTIDLINRRDLLSILEARVESLSAACGSKGGALSGVIKLIKGMPSETKHLLDIVSKETYVFAGQPPCSFDIDGIDIAEYMYKADPDVCDRCTTDYSECWARYYSYRLSEKEIENEHE